MADIVLLDGGMGQELVARSARAPSPLWSAEILEREPDLVEAVHRAFARAGATVLTLSAYSATVERLRLHMDGGVEARFETLQREAIRVARAARAGTDAALAGCLPPLVASFHAETAPEFEACLAAYTRIVALQAPAVEVILAETMASVREARAAARACASAGARCWTSFTVDDADGTRLRSGEALAAGARAAREEGAEALLLNCSRPEAVSAGLSALAAAGLPFGAYANGFVRAAELSPGATVAGMAVRQDLGPEAYAAHAMDWVRRGATIVGGCCEVGPEHIAHLAGCLRAAGHRIVAP